MVMIGRPPASNEQRIEFWDLRSAGATNVDAAGAVAVAGSTAQRWIRDSGGVKPRKVPPPTGRFLSLAEREHIDELLDAGMSKADIAKELKRSPSTISREVEGGTNQRGRYVAATAHRAAQQRAKRPKLCKLAANERLRNVVQRLLTKHHSPRQISQKLIRDFPDDPEMRLSHETIYLALYIQSRGGLKRELVKHLRTGRALRKGHRKPDERRGQIPGMINISERPAEANDRTAVPGHWEGDLVRHEALCNRVEVRDRHRWAVAAA
ncbi:IS30 family transposase [Antrihabitans sp. NCIMB 15449]|uniref:IS30 family transposase n=1 Tax=Antrihabitans spumae TaxID=3373370 RepID=A0ABW7JK79_9NOCA